LKPKKVNWSKNKWTAKFAPMITTCQMTNVCMCVCLCVRGCVYVYVCVSECASYEISMWVNFALLFLVSFVWNLHHSNQFEYWTLYWFFYYQTYSIVSKSLNFKLFFNRWWNNYLQWISLLELKNEMNKKCVHIIKQDWPLLSRDDEVWFLHFFSLFFLSFSYKLTFSNEISMFSQVIDKILI